MYTVTEFAKLIGVTAKTLREWDKQGILVPEKFKSGHRRYYTRHLDEIRNKNLGGVDKIGLIYVRVPSILSEKLARGLSKESREFCKKNGIKEEYFRFDRRLEESFRRPVFVDVIDIICSRKINCLVLHYKALYNRKDYEILIQLCEFYNIQVYFSSIEEDFEDLHFVSPKTQEAYFESLKEDLRDVYWRMFERGRSNRIIKNNNRWDNQEYEPIRPVSLSLPAENCDISKAMFMTKEDEQKFDDAFDEKYNKSNFVEIEEECGNQDTETA